MELILLSKNYETSLTLTENALKLTICEENRRRMWNFSFTAMMKKILSRDSSYFRELLVSHEHSREMNTVVPPITNFQSRVLRGHLICYNIYCQVKFNRVLEKGTFNTNLQEGEIFGISLQKPVVNSWYNDAVSRRNKIETVQITKLICRKTLREVKFCDTF